MARHARRGTRNHFGRKGFILPAGLFALILMTVLMVASLGEGLDERRSTRNLRESGVALYVAEAGMARTIGTWPAGASTLNPGDSLNLGWTTLGNQSKYRAVIHRVDDGASGTKLWNIFIEGVGAGSLGGRSNLTSLVQQTIVYGYGAVSYGEIVIGGSGSLVDTFDSNVGYVAGSGGANVTLLADAGITLNPATVVSGNLETATTWNGSGSVSGTIQQNVSPPPVKLSDYPTAACPTTGYTPASDLPSPLAPSTYDAGAGKFVVKSHIILDDTPSNGGYYFDLLSIADPRDISYSAPPNPVTIYTHDKLGESSHSM